MTKLLRFAAYGVVALALVALAASFHPEVQNVLRAINPSTDYDSTPPDIPDLARPAILLFSKTNGFRHAEAIDAGHDAFETLAASRGWRVFETENGAVCRPELLSRFDVVVWLNASGAPLDREQRQAFQDWIKAGGGFLALHSATDNSHEGWPWYQLDLVGAKFINHTMGPQFQDALIKRAAAEHPVAAALPEQWSHTEEWYSFDRSVRGQPGVTVLATVDESTYSPRFEMFGASQDISMGDHPVIWTREIGDGRAFFSVLGHAGEVYATDWHKAMLEAAVEWTGRLAGSEIEPAQSKTTVLLP